MTTIIKDETLTAIGNAIREKTGKANKLTPAEMATEIAGITTGGGEDKLGLYLAGSLQTYTNADITSNLTHGIDIAEVYLPNCTQVPDKAFENMHNVKKVIVKSFDKDINPKFIPSYQFSECSRLLEVGGLENTTRITTGMFDRCYSFKIPSSKLKSPIDSIGYYAFSNCSSLDKRLFIDKSVTYMSGNAFPYTSITDVYTPFTALPSGWNTTAFDSKVTIHYGVTEAEFDEILAAEV
jgi:hypothetical protein|nr:MAG TPA: leucine rich repeat protein [Caudoviricetes sp.]